MNLDFEALAQKMTARKQRLLKHGVRPAREDAMVTASHGKGDSPAQAAKRKAPKLRKLRTK
jgi:hypothetical protein